MRPIKYIGFFLILLFISCNDDNVKQVTEYWYLSDDIKRYMIQANSYWVYENDSTGEFDSIIITSTDKDFCIIFPGVHGTTIVYGEYFKMNFRSSYYKTTDNFFLCQNTFLRRGPSGYCFDGQPMYFPRMKVGDEWEGVSLIDSFAQIVINGNVFRNVEKLKITKSKQRRPLFDTDITYYFADSIGIIKQEIPDKLGKIQSWSITSWKIIRK